MTSQDHNSGDLIVCHCITHQENLYGKPFQFRNSCQLSTVIKCIHSIKSGGLNNSLFKELLENLHTDYHDLNFMYLCVSFRDMLEHFYFLKGEVVYFSITQGSPVVELSDNQWFCNLACMVDISKQLFELSVNSTLKYEAPINKNRTVEACDLYCCLLPQCAGVCACRSCSPIANTISHFFSSGRSGVHFFSLNTIPTNILIVCRSVRQCQNKNSTQQRNEHISCLRNPFQSMLYKRSEEFK